jgi:recombination protein RecA
MAKATKAPTTAEGRLASVLNKEWAGKVVLGRGETGGSVDEALATELDVFDHWLLPIGGLPIGRISEISGAEGGGKTALAMAFIGAAQRVGASTMLVDAEHSYDAERASVLGADPDRLVVGVPDHMEEAINMMRRALDNHDPSAPLLLVYDSVASNAANAKALEGDAGYRRVGDKPLLLSEELPKLVQQLKSARAQLLFINQERTDIKVRFGDPITTPGGRALKFYASWRLRVLGGKAIKDAKTGDHVGKVITALVTKTRFSPPFRKARVRFDYETGWNNVWTTLEHAKTRGAVQTRATKGTKAYLEALDALGWPKPAGLTDDGVEVVEDLVEDDGAEEGDEGGDDE